MEEKHTGKKVVRVIISVLLWIIILVAALFAFVNLATKDDTKIASIGGISPLVVQSESMSPTFNKDDLIIIKKCDTSQLQVGDIVTFHTIIENEYALNTHRIVEITEENGVKNFVTKGDNNAVEDTHVITEADIVGKYVTRVPALGKVVNFLSSTVGFLVCIVLPLLAFFIYQIYHLIMTAVEMKKATALETALEIEEEKERIRREAEAENKADAESDEAKADEGKTDETSADTAAEDIEKMKAETENALAEAEKARKALEEAKRMQAEAEKARKALEEAKRMQAEAEEALAKAKAAQDELNNK